MTKFIVQRMLVQSCVIEADSEAHAHELAPTIPLDRFQTQLESVEHVIYEAEPEEEAIRPIVKIMQDTDCESPRENDNVSVMFCKHGRYNILGDKDAEDPTVEDDDGVTIFRRLRDDVAICIQLSFYDHSGITIFHGEPTCRWDSGQVGWHYMTKKALQEEWNGDEAKARAYMEATIKEYDNYLRGNCWGYLIEGPGIDDSCWGFIGDDLEETGMLEHVDAKYHDLMHEAWEKRFDH